MGVLPYREAFWQIRVVFFLLVDVLPSGRFALATWHLGYRAFRPTGGCFAQQCGRFALELGIWGTGRFALQVGVLPYSVGVLP